MDDQIFEFFKIFADLQRIRLAAMLSDGAFTVEEITVQLRMKAVDVPRHLAMMDRLGLLVKEDEHFMLDKKALETLSRAVWADRRPQLTIKSNDSQADDFDSKVVRDYSLPDGRLREIPQSNKKFTAVLRHVVQAIEPGKRYTEKEVNTMLKQFHEDSASLRRGLIDCDMLRREPNGSAYWR